MSQGDMANKRLQTQAIHGGEAPNPDTGASSPELVMSSTFVVDEEISFSANNLTSETPFVYTRWDNPTTQKLEHKLALLEQTEACVAFASGMAASCAVMLAHLSQGDHLIISKLDLAPEFALSSSTPQSDARDPELLDLLLDADRSSITARATAQAEFSTLTLRPAQAMQIAEAYALLHALPDYVHRAKGFLPATDGMLLAQRVATDVTIEPCDEGAAPGLVLVCGSLYLAGAFLAENQGLTPTENRKAV